MLELHSPGHGSLACAHDSHSMLGPAAAVVGLWLGQAALFQAISGCNMQPHSLHIQG